MSIHKRAKGAQVRRLYLSGLSLRRVGEELNMSPWRVLRWLKVLGVPKRSNAEVARLARPRVDKACVRQLYVVQKLTLKEAAKELGIPTTSLWRFMRLHGIARRKPNSSEYAPRLDEQSEVVESVRCGGQEAAA